MFGTTIAEVRPYGRNLEDDCLDDLTYGKGIRLQSTEAYHKKADKFSKKMEKVWDGLQSEFFGASV